MTRLGKEALNAGVFPCASVDGDSNFMHMGILKDYLSFSSRERTGVIVVVFLVTLVFVIPELLPNHRKNVDAATLALFKKETDTLKTILDESSKAEPVANDAAIRRVNNTGEKKVEMNSALFYFDPNTISEAGWKELGMNDRTAATIVKYVSRGGRFRVPTDLGKIYGIKKTEYERLLPFVNIKDTKATFPGDVKTETVSPWKGKTNFKRSVVDINKADTTELISLPGIGSKLASRLVTFRERLGGFYSVDQVKELYGLQDSSFQKFRQYLTCDARDIRRININEADLESLKSHPYLKWNVAKAIVNYRDQHGKYASYDDLVKIEVLDPGQLEKVRPYLSVE